MYPENILKSTIKGRMDNRHDYKINKTMKIVSRMLVRWPSTFTKFF